MIDISIVIVNFNVKDALDNCLSSIYKSNTSSHNLEIFLVDNNSFDGSVELIKKKYPHIQLIENNKNLGFSKANNIALKLVNGKYILILNPDTILEEGTFQKLIDFINNNPKTGVVTSKLIKANGKLDPACKRSFPSLRVALPRLLGLSKLFPKSRIFGKYNLSYLDENKIHEVDAVNGAFMFMPKNVLDEVGLFDEDYFMYGEDIDLCFRIKKKGYKIFYLPEVNTIHLKGESTRKSKISYVNNFYGAMSIFVKKNLSGTNKLLPIIINIGIFLRLFLSYIKRIIKLFSFVLIDALLIFISLVLSVKLRFDIFPTNDYLFIITIYVIIWVILLSIFGVYSKKFKHSIKHTFNAIITGFFINSSITYFFKEYAFSRGVVLASTGFSLIFLITLKSIINLIIFFRKKNITLKKINLLVIGKKQLNQNLEDKLLAKYDIFYFNKIIQEKSISNLEEFIKFKGINEVLLTDDTFSNKEILSLMNDIKVSEILFKVIPTGKDLILSKLHSKIDEIDLIEIEYNINKKLNIFLKRLFDLVLSFFMLIFIYPFVFIYNKLSRRKLSTHFSKILLVPKVFSGKYSFVGMPIWYNKSDIDNLGKKGLTGIVQLKHDENLTTEDMDNYILYYGKNQSIILDIEILLKTLFSFIKYRSNKRKNL
ncbi:MAG: glycosyltransferase [Ignavibacteriales bacterium]|nr:glycosyltransferase [Ignavibacteriales bacterium]